MNHGTAIGAAPQFVSLQELEFVPTVNGHVSKPISSPRTMNIPSSINQENVVNEGDQDQDSNMQDYPIESPQRITSLFVSPQISPRPMSKFTSATSSAVPPSENRAQDPVPGRVPISRQYRCHHCRMVFDSGSIFEYAMQVG
jgi:hypothetical protein